MPAISLIIPVFNRRADLQRCLNSIPANATDRIEIIVIDDHSVEPLHDLCTSNIFYIRNEANLGPSYSRNIAARRAKGNILLFLDSDVELLPDTLASIEQILREHPDIACIGGSGPADEGGHDVAYVKTKYYDRSGRNRSLMRTKKEFPVSGIIDCDHFESASMAIRASVFKKIGGFDPFWFYMGEDRELCLRLRRAGYRVVVSWQARAIHHDRGLTRKQEPSFRRFLAKRFLEVAYKLDGMLGAMRWVWTNRSEIRYLLPFKLREMLVRMRELRQRRGHNYLQSDFLDDYVEFIREQYR